MRIPKKLTATLGISMASMLMIAGCTSAPDASQTGSDTAVKETVQEAFDNQQKVTAQSMTLQFDVEPSQLADIVEIIDEDDPTGADDGPSREMVERLAAMSITVESKSKDGKPLKENTDSANTDWGMFVDAPEGRMISVLNVNNAYFLKADMANVLSMLDMEGLNYDQLSQMAGQFPGDSAWLANLMSNQWITPDEKLSQSITEGIKSNDQANVLNQQDKAKKDAMDRVSKSAFDKSDFAESNGNITMSVPLKEVVNENKDDVALLMDKPTGDVQQLLGRMNDEKFNVYFKLEDKHFKQIIVDPIQLTHIIQPDPMEEDDRADYEKIKEYNLPIRIDLSRSTDNLAVPEGAATVTEDSIGMLMMLYMMSNPENVEGATTNG